MAVAGRPLTSAVAWLLAKTEKSAPARVVSGHKEVSLLMPAKKCIPEALPQDKLVLAAMWLRTCIQHVGCTLLGRCGAWWVSLRARGYLSSRCLRNPGKHSAISRCGLSIMHKLMEP